MTLLATDPDTHSEALIQSMPADQPDFEWERGIRLVSDSRVVDARQIPLDVLVR